MTIGEGRNVDRLVNRELCLSAQLPLHHDGSVQSPHYCRRSTDPPVDLPLHPPLTREQDPEVLELLHLGQDLIPDPEGALHPFPVEDHGLGLGGADSHPDRFTLGCEPVQRELEVTPHNIQGLKELQGALPPRSFLTTSATSAPEIGGPTPESPGPASLPEGVSVGLRRSSKYPFHRSTTSRVEVSSAPSPPYTVLTMHCFPLLRRRMVVQNLFEAVRKSFSMASPNSSHVRVFASVTTTAALRLACRYLPAASGVPQAKKFDGIPHRRCPPAGSGIAATAGTDHLAATALVGRLNNGGVEHGPLGLNVPRLPRYMVKALPEVGVEALSDRRLCQTFPADPHDTFGSASSAPLFARVSKTCGRKSDDTTTKSIIELRPRVSWCQAQTTVRIRPPTRRRREATLSSTGVNSNILAPSRGAIIATPARRLSPVATPEWKRVQPLSRRLVPEPLLCVEVRPTISSRNFSTSRTSSGSFTTREVTFHVPRASFCSRGSDRQGPRLRPPPSSHCTRPLWPLLLVVSRREGGPTSSFRAVPGRAPWV
ncbi:hypothetical protein N1851_025840 [Merluccius polli]|uniref:Uncharacterized protein n=1 Tax=Merluccius polli TaxID=89951 RepID=A0AA47MD56_MERPO|nr:hypothetical protein N1851_025840 [Merluccius polli]